MKLLLHFFSTVVTFFFLHMIVALQMLFQETSLTSAEVSFSFLASTNRNETILR